MGKRSKQGNIYVMKMAKQEEKKGEQIKKISQNLL